jgi:hypothetical protein
MQWNIKALNPFLVTAPVAGTEGEKQSGVFHLSFQMRERERELTCTGLAATRSPATLPPTTRPSGLAKETLIPPDLLLVP